MGNDQTSKRQKVKKSKRQNKNRNNNSNYNDYNDYNNDAYIDVEVIGIGYRGLGMLTRPDKARGV